MCTYPECAEGTARWPNHAAARLCASKLDARALSIDFAQHDIEAAQDADDVGDRVAQAHLLERRQVDEARAADVVAIGRRRAVGHDVVAELALGVLDPRIGLARGHLDLVALLAGQDRPLGDVARRPA